MPIVELQLVFLAHLQFDVLGWGSASEQTLQMPQLLPLPYLHPPPKGEKKLHKRKTNERTAGEIDWSVFIGRQMNCRGNSRHACVRGLMLHIQKLTFNRSLF